MTEEPSPRLLRLINSLPEGAAAFDFLSEPRQLADLLAATRRGLPAVCGISSSLLSRFGDAAGRPNFKQFVGLAIAHLMAKHHGYEVSDRGVKVVADPVFASGARYRPRAAADRQRPISVAPNSSPQSLAARLVAALSDQELRELAETLPREFAHRGISV